MPGKKPRIALIYDFDKTLCTKNMQEYGFIPSIGMSSEAFWKKTNDFAKKNGVDGILAYMRVMVEEARSKRSISYKDFVEMGARVEFYPGLDQWFEAIDRHTASLGALAEHYIISSGLGEIIEGTSVAKRFKMIYASRFFYDEYGKPEWPAMAVNYTNKTQYLFRINKGVLDSTEDDALNHYVNEEDRPVPFRNMIYFGDGLTDVPSMKQVKVNGGCSIAVYPAGRQTDTAKELLENGRVDYILPADYTPGKKLDQIVRRIIHRSVLTDGLIRENREQLKKLREAKGE